MESLQGYELRVKNTFIDISEVGEFRRQASSPAQLEPITSLIVKELPFNIHFGELRELLDSEGFQGTYDFLYLRLLSASFELEAGLDSDYEASEGPN